jgi:hypothetical protein
MCLASWPDLACKIGFVGPMLFQPGPRNCPNVPGVGQAMPN